MTLVISHDIYTGSCEDFNDWRAHLAEHSGRSSANLPRGAGRRHNNYALVHPAEYEQIDADDALMGDWRRTPPPPPDVLFLHADCEGYIHPPQAPPLADTLANLLDQIPEDKTFGGADKNGHPQRVRDLASRFMAGLRLAASRNEKIVFA